MCTESKNHLLDLERRPRSAGLDLYRVVAAVVTFAFHSYCHLGANWGWFNYVARNGAAFMTAFFMLSGFSIFRSYANENLIKIENMKLFWIKRLIKILPLYYIVALLTILFGLISNTVMDEIKLAPAEILGIQSTFSSLFEFSHNGGSWFISCILICYLVYPFLQEVLKQISIKSSIVMLCLCVAILLYAPLVVRWFGLNSIYSNPFFRILEFTIGAILASLKNEWDTKPFVKKYVYNWISVTLVGAVMALGMTIAVRAGIGVGDYMLYNWICLPCLSFILLGMSGTKMGFLEKSKLLRYCSTTSYAFYFSQFFFVDICRWIIGEYDITNCFFILVLSWTVCIILTLMLYEWAEKPITRFLRRKLIDWA